jgi:hypothetical protein
VNRPRDEIGHFQDFIISSSSASTRERGGVQRALPIAAGRVYWARVSLHLSAVPELEIGLEFRSRKIVGGYRTGGWARTSIFRVREISAATQNAITPRLRQLPHLDKAPNAPTNRTTSETLNKEIFPCLGLNAISLHSARPAGEVLSLK